MGGSVVLLVWCRVWVQARVLCAWDRFVGVHTRTCTQMSMRKRDLRIESPSLWVFNGK